MDQPRFKLYDAQQVQLDKSKPTYYYIMKMGTGKTVVGLSYVMKWAPDKDVVVIAPKQVVKAKSWQKDFELPDDWFTNVLGEANEYYIKNDADIEVINREMRNLNFDNTNSNLNVFAEIDDAIMYVVENEYIGIDKIPVSQLATSIDEYLYNNMINNDPKKLKKQIGVVMTREGYVKKFLK